MSVCVYVCVCFEKLTECSDLVTHPRVSNVILLKGFNCYSHSILTVGFIKPPL